MKPGPLGRRCAARPDAHRGPTRSAPSDRFRGRRNLRDRIHGTDHADHRRVAELVAQGVRRKEAAAQVASETGLSKKALYDAGLT